MTSPTQAQDGIKRVWHLACEKEKLHPRYTVSLPLLFALDAELEIPGGFIYSRKYLPDGNRYWPGNFGDYKGYSRDRSGEGRGAEGVGCGSGGWGGDGGGRDCGEGGCGGGDGGG
ncbi:MAG: hypothetical protein ACRESZ_20255 [Methylococcales bacterium]